MRKPTNKVREAMLKLGTRWKVKRNEQGIKRKPAEVAKDLEARMHENANAWLTRNNSSSVEASAPKISRTAEKNPLITAFFSSAAKSAASASGTSLSRVA